MEAQARLQERLRLDGRQGGERGTAHGVRVSFRENSCWEWGAGRGTM